MSSGILPEIPQAGFSFDNYQRNEMLASKGYPIPKATKTGTTIAGIIFKDGVILGADTRATGGSIVADKVCDKLHYLAPNMYCGGAGTSADCDRFTRMMSSQLELHALNTGKEVPVSAANRLIKQYLYRYQGHIGAALILGGVDSTGPKLSAIFPHGSTDTLPFATMGSGSYAAMAILEARWKPGMGLEEGKKLVADAIAAGIFNDLGSGSNIDLCIVTRGSSQHIRPYIQANVKGVREGRYAYKKGTTAVLTSKVVPVVVEDVMIRQVDPDADAMDTSS